MSTPAKPANLLGLSLGRGPIVLCPRCALQAGALMFQRVGTDHRPCDDCGDTPEQAAARVAEAELELEADR